MFSPTLERQGLLSRANVQYGMAPPGGHRENRHGSQLHSVSDPISHSVPFLFYPTRVEQGFYEGPYQTGHALLPYLPPFHGRFGLYECPFEPAFIQKRNERERQRVKCVNQGYAKLRDHLPGASGEKRLSKVETLRAAIRYINYLQGLVEGHPCEGAVECGSPDRGASRLDISGHSDGGSPRSLSASSSPSLYHEESEGFGS